MGTLLRFILQLAVVVVLVGWLAGWSVFEPLRAVQVQPTGSLAEGTVGVILTYRPWAQHEAQRHAQVMEEDTGWRLHPVKGAVQPRAPREVEPFRRARPVEQEPRAEH